MAPHHTGNEHTVLLVWKEMRSGNKAVVVRLRDILGRVGSPSVFFFHKHWLDGVSHHTRSSQIFRRPHGVRADVCRMLI